MTSTPRAQDATRGILARLGQAEHLALFFDYDGTLSPFASRPELAALPTETRAVLQRLAHLPEVVVGVISSRRVQEIIDLVALDGVFYAGLSGLEKRLADGTIERHPALLRGEDSLESIGHEISGALEAFPGAWLEDKHGTLAVHHRHLEPERFGDLAATVRKLVRKHADRFRLERNATTLEVRPALDVNKGHALKAFLDALPFDAVPLFAGDDVNDEPALRTVRDLGGVGIGVGDHAPSAAEFRLPSPAALQELLEKLASQRSSEGRR